MKLSSKPWRNHFAFGDELLEVRVGDLDRLLLERQVLQLAPARAVIACALAAALAVTCERFARLRLDVLGQAERAGQRVELAQLVLVLEAQLLLVIGSLGLGDEDLALPKLQLQAQALVRRAQILALMLELCDALHRRLALLARGFAVCARGFALRFQLRL